MARHGREGKHIVRVWPPIRHERGRWRACVKKGLQFARLVRMQRGKVQQVVTLDVNATIAKRKRR